MSSLFLEASEDVKNSNIVIAGYPYDSTSSFRSGSRKGPNAIREYSWNLETFSPFTKMDIHTKKYADSGDIELPFGDTKRAINMIYSNTKKLLKKGKKVISLGGEHTVTYPIIKAYSEFYDDFIMIVFDAHADLRDNYLGVKYSHACAMNLCSGVIGSKRICQFGIRSYTKEEYEYSPNMLHFSDNLNDFDFNKIKNKRIYISIDIDALDSSVVPGTGTPEPGGLFFREFMDFLLKFSNYEVIGCDLVELAPDYDPSGISAAAASKITRELILLL